MLERTETALSRRLKASIQATGPLTFREFMAAALYDDAEGFYTRGPSIGAANAAFSTSAKHPAFAFALAQAVEQADDRLGKPARIIEFGGGTGELGARIKALTGLDRSYVVVDASAGLRAEQATRGLDAVPNVQALRAAPTFAFGNEVLDALPVHRVAGDGDGGVLEVVVDVDARGSFVERLRPPSTPALAARFTARGVTLGRGQVAEVCLEVEAFVAAASRALAPGYLVFIDYGDDAKALYDGQRLNGTLKAYRDQARVYDAFDHVGATDLTADVDFTTVTAAAVAAGLEPAGDADQGPWLKSLGIDAFADEAADRDAALESIEAVTSPVLLGSAFRVACFKTPGLPDAPGFVAT